MKKSLFNILGAAAMLGMTLTTFQGCKVGDPLEGVTIAIKADAVSAPYEFRVVDAKTGTQANLPDNYIVKVTGPGASQVYTPGGSRTIRVFQGILQFSLRKGYNPTSENPLKFNFEFSGTSYLDLVYPVEITSSTQFSKTISLVNFENPPAGSSGKKEPVPTGSDGSATDTIKITVPKTAEKTEEAKVVINEGTILKDKDGNPVTGSLEAKVLHSTPTEDALASFPGGTNVGETKDASGNSQAGGEMKPAGWVDMKISAGSSSVKSFSTPIEVNMEINPTTINPSTSVPYKEGDDMEVYSLSEGEGNWVKEGTTKVIKNAETGKLEAPMSVTHLSVWMAGVKLQACNQKLKLEFNNTVNTNPMSIIIEIRNAGASASIFRQTTTVPATTNTTVEYDFKPAENVRYDVYATTNGNTFEYKNVLLCGTTQSITIPSAGSGQIGFKITIKCENGNQVLLPDNYTVYYIREGEYQNPANIVPEINGKPEHKIDPSDGVFNNVSWKSAKVRAVQTSTENYNLLVMSTSDSYFTTGHQYRFSVYYNDGSKTSREDYLTVEYTDVIKGSGVFPVDITISTCPF